GAARRDEGEAIGLVDDDAGPRVRAARRGLGGKRVEGPAQRAGCRIERAYLAGGRPDAAGIGHGRPDDHEIAIHGRRRRHAVLARPCRRTPQPLGEIDFAVAPEPVAAMPVALIQADEAAVDGSDIDALAVHRGASIREVPVVGVAPNLEVYSPNLAPGARIEAATVPYGVER